MLNSFHIPLSPLILIVKCFPLVSFLKPLASPYSKSLFQIHLSPSTTRTIPTTYASVVYQLKKVISKLVDSKIINFEVLKSNPKVTDFPFR